MKSGLSVSEAVGMSGDEPMLSGDTASAAHAFWGGASASSTPPMQSLGVYGETIPTHGMRPGRGGLQLPLQKRTGGGIQVGEHTGFLRMRGLPFSAAREDIYKFFEGYNPVLETIVLTFRNDGRATGEAYVGFATAEDSRRAMDLHRRTMGSRYIELFISNKEEQGRALARFGSR
jgi:heterogeneous nuclear ribonucleoprotein F/H